MDRSRHKEIGIAFGKALKALRAERGLSQVDLAQLANFDRTYPSLLERGLRTPGLQMLFKIADALGVHPNVLIEETKKHLETETRSTPQSLASTESVCSGQGSGPAIHADAD